MIIQRALKRYSIPGLMKLVFHRFIGLSTNKYRALPDFIIIGAQRAGTTSLFNYLAEHPDIHPSIPKETQYFSIYFNKGLSWYRSHFPLTSNREVNNRYQKQTFVSGEATPYYIFHPYAAKRIFDVIPNVRLIILLRNPVDRAYSHYQYEKQLDIEKLTFKEAVGMETERLAGELETMISDDSYQSFNYQHFSYLLRGKYIDQIIDWNKYFSLDQMLILSSEDFFHNPGITLDRVTEFLDLENIKISTFGKYNSTQSNQMNSSLRASLIEYFKPYNLRLYDFLNHDFGWNN